MANSTVVFITFEGIEAAGKSTLISALNDDLRSRGENVLVTREPGGTPLGDRIRQIWRDPASAIDPLAEALLMSADRAQHVATVITPALRSGATILCDRYFDATIAYQGFGRGLDIEMLLELSLLATSRITPDLTFLIDIPPELSLARVRARGEADRMELEDLAFHTRVRAGYAELVKRYTHRFVVIDGTVPPSRGAGCGAYRHQRAAGGDPVIDGQFDLVGASGPKQFFEGLTAETLSHGYLFAGPAGVGKKTFALRLAQSLLCVTPKTTLLGYCGICSGCTRVTSGVHPDLYFSEGQVKIGERENSGFHAAEDATARDLVRQLSMHSYAGGWRVFVLGDVDFTREAANALLKFFEEPPPGVVLFLTTTAVARLLPTVRSRLLEVTFAPLAPREIATILEREGVEPDVAAHAAAIAGGSVTRARALLDGEGTMRDAAVTWFFETLEGGTPDATGWATRPTLEEGLEVVKTLTRDWLALSVGGTDVPLLARDQAERIGRLPRRDPAAIARALGALGDAERVARTNVSPALVADLAKMALATTSVGAG